MKNKQTNQKRKKEKSLHRMKNPIITINFEKLKKVTLNYKQQIEKLNTPIVYCHNDVRYKFYFRHNMETY